MTGGVLPDDARFMRAALALGKDGQGQTWPNPSVGCLIVKGGRVLAGGRTQRGGRPHAETVALEAAGKAARGATAYVTLEPCAHWGRTPPCAKALVEAGVARVVVGCVDPDPRVDGRGLAWLEEGGIEVVTGVLEERAQAAHLGLRRRVLDGRPMVTLKLAQSLDGRLAARTGHSQWVTGAAARLEAHRLRATHDAIMVGSGTALHDDPRLTCRLPGVLGRDPVRVVVDRRLRLPVTSALARTAREVPVWVYTGGDADPGHLEALRALGVEAFPLDDTGLVTVLGRLAARGVTRLLVEGGSVLAGAFVRQGLVDRLHVAVAPTLIGGDGLPALAALGLDRVSDAPRFRLVDEKGLGGDAVRVYEPIGRG